MKQTTLKLIRGGVQDSAVETSLAPKNGTRWWEYTWMFALSGMIWTVIGISVWQYVFR